MLAAGSHLAGAPACMIPRGQQPKPLHNNPAAVSVHAYQYPRSIFSRCSQVTSALPQRHQGDYFDDVDDVLDNNDGGSFGRPTDYLAPSIIFPELGERLAAQAAEHAARNALDEHQASLDEVKAKAKEVQRGLDAMYRDMATMQGVLDRAYAVLDASCRDQLRGRGGRKHSGEPGGLSIPRHRRPAAEAAKRMRWVTKMQARCDLTMDDYPG